MMLILWRILETMLHGGVAYLLRGGVTCTPIILPKPCQTFPSSDTGRKGRFFVSTFCHIVMPSLNHLEAKPEGAVACQGQKSARRTADERTPCGGRLVGRRQTGARRPTTGKQYRGLNDGGHRTIPLRGVSFLRAESK